MPRTCIDTDDAVELAETLQLIAGWLTADPERLAASLLEYIGHPAYGWTRSAPTWTASPSSSAATTERTSSACTDDPGGRRRAAQPPR